MNMKIFVTIFAVFLLSLTVFAASGQTADGNTRVELVYMTDIGDNNLFIDENYRLDLAGDDLTGGRVTTDDGNYVRIGVFFTDFEFTKYKIYITLINPNCGNINLLNLIRFNVYAEMGQPIDDINYVLNGNPGLDLNGFCTGSDSNQSCARLDPNMIPFVTNTITIYASAGVNVESVSCDFNYRPSSGNNVIFMPRTDWVMLLLIILIGGGILFFLTTRRRRD